jgi:predicted dehydrogenase
MASAAGGRVLGIDINPQRVSLAASLGMQTCLRSEAESTAQAFTHNQGFDSLLICADTRSNDPVGLAALIARDRAKVVATGAVGLSLPRKIYYEKELSFINSRSYGPGRYDPGYEEGGLDYPIGFVRWTEGRNFQAVVELLAGGKLNVKALITHRFPIDQAPEAYEIITGKKKEPFLGVLLTYPQDDQGVPAERIPVRHGSAAADGDRKQPAVIKLGVLGAGNFANATLLPAIRKMAGIELVGIASAAGLHAASAARKHGFAYAASSADEIFDDPSINTVAILTRHDTHASLAVKALQAGKHVFVEKPLAIDNTGLEMVLSALSQERGLLTVGFNRRFAPLAQELRTWLAKRQEPLHMHYRLNAGYIPPTHWVQDPAQGGGRVIGEGCHFVDFLAFLAGGAPVSVSAHALPDEGKYRQDILSMTFTFPDGSLGVVDYLANGDKSFPKERLEVFCAGRIAVLDDFRSLELIQDGRRKILRKAQDKGWQAEWAVFAKAIREDGQPPIPYEQLAGVTRATFKALESLREGGRPVQI